MFYDAPTVFSKKILAKISHIAYRDVLPDVLARIGGVRIFVIIFTVFVSRSLRTAHVPSEADNGRLFGSHFGVALKCVFFRRNITFIGALAR